MGIYNLMTAYSLYTLKDRHESYIRWSGNSNILVELVTKETTLIMNEKMTTSINRVYNILIKPDHHGEMLIKNQQAGS